MKLVAFTSAGLEPTVGLLVDGGVLSLAEIVGKAESAQAAMQALIDGFSLLRPQLERLAEHATPLPIDQVHLLAPLRPGKILCSTGTYAQPGADPAPLLMTLKSAESVIGPGETIQLPDVDPSWDFVPEAELGLVIRGPAKQVGAADWRSAVFGYTCVVDVMGRGDTTFGRDYWLAKADTLGPLGPCIVTADEVVDPNVLRVRSWQNGQPRQDFAVGEALHGVPQLVEFATSIMTLYTGDVLACGTSPVGLEPLDDGDSLEVAIDGIGRLPLKVAALAGRKS
jgi:2-keto-4-pentenoate hydratase/2-oxohepta-3-ene-1,7-dioic acid hydratase in catechol pathway